MSVECDRLGYDVTVRTITLNRLNIIVLNRQVYLLLLVILFIYLSEQIFKQYNPGLMGSCIMNLLLH